MIRSALLFLAVAAGVFLPALTYSQSRSLTPEKLALQADVVALGRVSGVSSSWDATHTKIVTRATIAVDRFVKGGSGQSALTLTVPGGEVGDTGEMYSHTAHFRENEEVVVFANSDAAGILRVTAGDQGKFTVTEDRLTGRRMAGEGLSLEVLLSRVHTAIAAPGR